MNTRLTESQSFRIQVLRGLAIAAVVFLHCTPAGIMQVYVRPVVNFSVGTFIFLSGFLSSKESWHPGKRVLRVLIPYIIWTVIFTVQLFEGDQSELPGLIGWNLLTGKSDGIMYFIFVYCEFTLLIPLIDLLARSRLRWIGFLITPVEIVLMRTLPAVQGTELSETMQILISVSCLGWFTYFYLGYMLGNGIIDVKMPDPLLAVLIPVSLVIQGMEAYWQFSLGIRNCGTQMKVSAVLSGALICAAFYKWYLEKAKEEDKEPGFVPKFFKVLGDCSFGVYFVHIFFKRILFGMEGFSEAVPFPLNGVILLILSFAFALSVRKILGKFAGYIGF